MAKLIEGKQHGSPMLAKSQLVDYIKLHCTDGNGYPFCVYWDTA